MQDLDLELETPNHAKKSLRILQITIILWQNDKWYVQNIHSKTCSTLCANTVCNITNAVDGIV